MTINYNTVLQQAANSYNTTLAGYRNTLQQQQQAQQGVMAGYNALQAGVLGGLEQGSANAKQEIADQYSASAGKQQLGLISRGLGNTTIQNSITRGLEADQAKAQNQRLASFADMAANRRTQLGLAGLGYAGNALQSNLQFAGQGLQYGGQGAFQLGQLGLGFAGLENQQAMQQAAFKNQMDREKVNQLYGAGGGFGVSKPIGGSSGLPSGRVGTYGGGSSGGYHPPQSFWMPGGGRTPYASGFADPVELSPSAGWNPDQYGWGGESSEMYTDAGDGYTYAPADGGSSGDGWEYEGFDY